MTKEELLNSGLPGVVCLTIGEHNIQDMLRILYHKTKWPDRDFVLVNITDLPYNCTDATLNKWAELSNVPIVDMTVKDMWHYASTFVMFAKANDVVSEDKTCNILNHCLDYNPGDTNKRFALFYI